MTKAKSDARTDRRSFLKMAGTSVVGGGAAAAASVVPAVAATPEPEKSDGYQETEHVRRYYELAKFM
jgi:hypothetical protein